MRTLGTVNYDANEIIELEQNAFSGIHAAWKIFVVDDSEWNSRGLWRRKSGVGDKIYSTISKTTWAKLNKNVW